MVQEDGLTRFEVLDANGLFPVMREIDHVRSSGDSQERLVIASRNKEAGAGTLRRCDLHEVWLDGLESRSPSLDSHAWPPLYRRAQFCG